MEIISAGVEHVFSLPELKGSEKIDATMKVLETQMLEMKCRIEY